MLRDITIGKYYNVSSPVHSLDPRTKLILLLVFMVMIFTLSTPLEYLLMGIITLLCIVLSRVPFSYILKGMKPIWLLIVFTAVINLFLSGGENIIFKWKIFSVTEESVYVAITMMVRIVLLITMSSLLTLTTSPMELTGGMEKLMKPLEKIHFPAHEIAMMMSIALRFIPILTDEAEIIMKAQASRGNDFESGNIIQRAKAMVPLLIPLLLSAFRRADELATAMEARCYQGGVNRTNFRQLKYKKGDCVAFLSCAFCVLALIASHIVGVMV
ncbi:MAG: energy-coupling factor transporter transmembrane component T family protein [Clostridia bacterium]